MTTQVVFFILENFSYFQIYCRDKFLWLVSKCFRKITKLPFLKDYAQLLIHNREFFRSPRTKSDYF